MTPLDATGIREAVQDRIEAEAREPGPGAKGEAGPVPRGEGNGSPNAFPGHVMTGAAGVFAETMAEFLEPPAHFFYMAFLTCLGTLLSGRVTLQSELRPEPRLYAVILGESADDRKSTAITKTIDFFKSAVVEFPVCLGVGSAEGLQRVLAKKPNLLLVYDEFKAFVSKAKTDGSVLLPCATTLFESTRYESHTKDREISLADVHLSLLAASTIQTYEKTWDSQFTDIGLNNRLFLVPGAGKRRFSIPGKVPVHEWDLLRRELGNVLRAASIVQELPITPEARELFQAWYMGLEPSVHTKRLDTYAMRFMVLLSVNSCKGEVDGDVVTAVIDLMDWQKTARRFHDPIDADSTVARLEEKIRRVLATGPKSDRDLRRAVNYQRAGLWVYQSAIKNLTAGREVRFLKSSEKWEAIST